MRWPSSRRSPGNCWRLRQLSRDRAELPANAVLSPMKLALLQRHPDVRLRPDATIRDAMLAIAALGGHIRNNGDPGGRCSEEGTRTFSSWNVVPRWLSDVINPEGRNPGGPGAA